MRGKTDYDETGILNRITREEGKRSGQPCIRGLRLTVSDILGYLFAGMSIEEILNDFPQLQREDVQASLLYCQKLLASFVQTEFRDDK